MNPLRHLLLAILTGLAASAAPIQFESRDRQAPLVELYTSEGCSSCPPAEAWLSRLKEAPGLWSDFVPVAFHVDYWDHLGWSDKWASKGFSDRQRAYVQSWGSASLYTPGFVLNGREWSGWRGAPPAPGNKSGVLKVTSEDAEHWQATFVPASPGASSYQVHSALLGSGLFSDVKAGENAGRRLRHDFTVLGFTEQPMVRKNSGFQATFILVARQRTPEGKLALAVWTTRTGRLESLQAVGGWLVGPEKN
jgi:hypothetical protein